MATDQRARAGAPIYRAADAPGLSETKSKAITTGPLLAANTESTDGGEAG